MPLVLKCSHMDCRYYTTAHTHARTSACSRSVRPAYSTDACGIKVEQDTLTDQDTLKVSLRNNAPRPLGRLCVMISRPPF